MNRGRPGSRVSRTRPQPRSRRGRAVRGPSTCHGRSRPPRAAPARAGAAGRSALRSRQPTRRRSRPPPGSRGSALPCTSLRMRPPVTSRAAASSRSQVAPRRRHRRRGGACDARRPGSPRASGRAMPRTGDPGIRSGRGPVRPRRSSPVDPHRARYGPTGVRTRARAGRPRQAVRGGREQRSDARLASLQARPP